MWENLGFFLGGNFFSPVLGLLAVSGEKMVGSQESSAPATTSLFLRISRTWHVAHSPLLHLHESADGRS